MAERWAGAVLTGGASSRMGRDKAGIEIAGVSMAGRVAAALLAAGAADVARVGGPSSDVAEDDPGEGPLGGVLAALAWSPAPIVVVAPCDLLMPDASAFARLAAAAAAPGAVAAVSGPDRPLPIALRTEAATPLAAAFAAGERSLRRAVAALRAVVVDLPDDAVADADEPGDLPADAR